ncbi:MAG: DNA alkylation repair protein [Clostridia bacterium]|nr:DNA alkylation repair protein [Clostridia bacterium]
MSEIREITDKLFSLQDKKYHDFQLKLIPGANPATFIGVRTPELRAFAKELSREADISVFLNDLPHKYFDENQLHAFILSEIKDFDNCIREVDRFLPFVDNWATCDQLSPKVFKKHKAELLVYIKRWMASDKVYTVRFATGMLLTHFLDEDFDKSYLDMAADIRSNEYYINMMTAWFFATALAKQYDTAVKYIENRRLDTFTHNKAIQKACESYRVSKEHKEYLKLLKIKESRGQ